MSAADQIGSHEKRNFVMAVTVESAFSRAAEAPTAPRSNTASGGHH
jgi:hypothetical protein